MVLIYCPTITALSGRTGGNERGRDKRMGGRERAKQGQTDGEREKTGNNQPGRQMRESKATEKH